jgi:beta-lactamase superfamily II metal-dependent hydrolase/predicted heme/steroid binding protein
MSDYEKMTGDKKISEIEDLVEIDGEEKVLVAYNGQNYVISVARLINDGHTHSYTQLDDLQDLMDIVDAQYQHKKDSTLPTESKEVSGAITEIYNLISQLNDEELESLKSQVQELVNEVEDNSSQLAHSEVKIIGVETSEGGDCTILIFPNGETMLIDCLVASEVSKITNVLANNNINKIDYVLITHYHIDHCGSINLLNHYFNNKTVFYLPQVLRDILDSEILKNETLVINTAMSQNCQIVRPNENQVVEIEDIKLTFLNTEHDRYYDDEVFNYNNLSVSLIVEYGTQRLFLSGDVATTAQEYLKDKVGKVNIYKAHHHASDFFQNSSYLLSLKPEIIYGCCGSGQYATLVYVRAFTDLVTQYGIPFYPTSINGNVEISMRMNESLIKGFQSIESYSHISTIETLLKTKILGEDCTKYTLKDITDAIPFQTTFDFMINTNQFPNVLPETFKATAYSFRGKKSHNGWFIIEVTNLVTLHDPSYIHVVNGVPYFLDNLKMTLETGNTTNANTHTVTYNNGYARDVIVDGNTIQGISYCNDIEVWLKVVNTTNGVIRCSVFGQDINFYHNANGTDTTMWYTFKMLNVPFTFANNYDIFINKTEGAVINATISIKRTGS